MPFLKVACQMQKNEFTMNELSDAFPKTREDLSNLQKSAVDAAGDLGSTTLSHAKTVQGQIHNLAEHAQEEGRQGIRDLGTKLEDLWQGVREYVHDRPLAVLATGAFVGFVLGRRSIGRNR
jgi:ElaB/YqjD/DUF883 family membrane-anchored ribosome-binding protein